LGGGVTNGKQANPKAIRVVKLGGDIIIINFISIFCNFINI
jgi:hypothetical protein